MKSGRPPTEKATRADAGRRAYRALAICTLVFAAACSSPACEAKEWIRKSSTTDDLPVPNDGEQQTCCIVLDVDKDGVEDFVVGERTRTPSIVWYKYNGKGWDRRVIDDTRLKPEAGGDSRDVDRDGGLDILMKPYHHNSPRLDVLLNPRFQK